MRSFLKKPLYRIIAFFTTLVIVLSMGVYSYYVYMQREGTLVESMKQDSQNTLQSLQKNLSYLIEAYAVNEYELLVENEMHHKNFSFIAIDDYNMAQILNEAAYVTGKIISPNGDLIDYDAKNGEHKALLESCYYLQSRDIFSTSDKKIGSISICSTDKIMKEELRGLLMQNIFVSLIFSLLLSLTLLFILRRFAILPLSHIVETLAEQDDDGIPVNKMQEFGSYEFEVLSKKINFLLDAVTLYRAKVKQVIAELNKERERLSFAMQGSNDGLWDWNIKTNEIFFSARWKEILGYADDELENEFSVWERLVHPDDKKLSWIEFERFLASQDPQDRFNIHTRLLHKDGHYVPILSRAKKVFNEYNEVERLVGTHVDVTELTQSREKLRRLLDSLSIGVVVHAPDTSILTHNPKAAQTLGLTSEQLQGVKAIDPQWHFIDGDRNVLPLQEYPVNKILTTKENVVNMLVGINKNDNSKTTWAYVNGFPVLDSKNEVIEIIINFIDITELKNKDETLSNQYALIENIINTVPVRIFWKDRDGVYLGANRLFLEDAKLDSADEIIGKNDFEMPWAKSDAQIYKDDDLSIIHTAKAKINFEESQTDEHGNTITLLTSKVPLKDDKGEIVGVLGTYVDISEQRKIERELTLQKNMLDYQAHHDALTGLPNRVLFNDRLEQAIERAKRRQTNIALLFIDLDHFKEINDSLGHDVGDMILKTVSKRIKEIVRDKDTVSRLGGDEFIVILEDLSQSEDASLIADKILDSLSKAVIVDENILYVSCSIGISIYPDDGISIQDLLKFADSAMYKAKSEGRNNYQYYNSSMTELAFERVVMEASLRAALENEEFVVFYQPQINGITNQIIGMEALVRWQHPTMGLVSPVKFIPLAESTGLIVELDRYVMKTAMKQLAAWYKAGYNPGVLAMNLAVKQLKKDDFIQMLQNLIEETACKAEWLELEVTEGQIMTNPDEAIKVLKQISDLGVELAIDDFGTGYSSLAYLKRLPIDKLKIDQAFVHGLPDDEEDAGIAKAVIALAHSLNLKIIAEGVETQEQKEFLVANGCENIQGYFYSKPITAEKFEALFELFSGNSKYPHATEL